MNARPAGPGGASLRHTARIGICASGKAFADLREGHGALGIVAKGNDAIARLEIVGAGIEKLCGRIEEPGARVLGCHAHRGSHGRRRL